MKFLDRLWGTKSAPRALTADEIMDFIDHGGSIDLLGQHHVGNRAALQTSTVLACVKLIAQGCATPPLQLLREGKDKTRQHAVDHPAYRLLTRRPNAWQTSYEWRLMMTLHAALSGAGLSVKVRNDRGQLIELIPVAPGFWHKRQVSRYELVYDVYDDFGPIGHFQPDDVFELPNLQWEWHRTMDAVQLASRAIGLGRAAEQGQASIYKNGMRPSGAYTVDGTLTKDQHDRLTEVLARHTGSNNAGKPLVLDRGAKWIGASVSSVDAQSLETRRLQVEEVCRAWGVFPIMIGHDGGKTATFASSESFFSAHLVHTLAPWHECWVQRLDEMLLDGSGPISAAFDTRYMRNGSMRDRAQWVRTLAEMGVYTRNELREHEGKDPLPGLDDPLTPMNMTGTKPGPKDDDENQD